MEPSSAAASLAGPVASDLCRTCGLCCDGTLFGHVPVTADEQARLRHRLPILPPSEKRGLRIEQRCAALGPRGCDVYSDRPERCAQFSCNLLTRVEADELTVGEAFDVLASILVVVDRLDRTLPVGSTFHHRRYLLPEIGERMRPELAVILQETWSDLATLDRLVAQHMIDRTGDGDEAARG